MSSQKSHAPAFRDDDSPTAVLEFAAGPEDGEVRWEMVERVRGEIIDGVYETDEKFNLAVDRLLQDL